MKRIVKKKKKSFGEFSVTSPVIKKQGLSKKKKNATSVTAPRRHNKQKT